MLEGIPCKCGTCYMLKWIREFQDALADRAELPTLYETY